MLKRAKLEWQDFKHWPAGRRFTLFYERHHRPGIHIGKVLVSFAAAVTFVIGVILAFIPGPAILFFAITAALVATQSRWVAGKLDRSEMWGRKRWRAIRQKRARAKARRLRPSA
jgi:hypothetical protein